MFKRRKANLLHGQLPALCSKKCPLKDQNYPEFLNRIDEIITFRHLDKDDFAKIAEIMLKQLSDHLVEKGIKLTYTKDALKIIAEESYSEKYGARNMRRYIERNVEDNIANLIIDSMPNRICAIAITAEDGKLKIDSI